jgi:hypothetical protein
MRKVSLLQAFENISGFCFKDKRNNNFMMISRFNQNILKIYLDLGRQEAEPNIHKKIVEEERLIQFDMAEENQLFGQTKSGSIDSIKNNSVESNSYASFFLICQI